MAEVLQVSVNEVVDPWMVIARLQTELRTLKQALRQARSLLIQAAPSSDGRSLKAEWESHIRS